MKVAINMNWLKRIEEEEREKAIDDAKAALFYWRSGEERDVKKLLQIIYGVDETAPPATFVNTGNIKEIALYSSKVILTLFPFENEKDFQNHYKATPDEISYLVSAGKILPLFQPASRYDGMNYIYPIVKNYHKDYFLRSVYFYAIFFDDCIELVQNGRLQFPYTLSKLYEKGKKNEGLRKALLEEYREGRELYDRSSFSSPSEKALRILENIAYRYASVASFIGEEVTDYLIDSLKPQECLKTLLHLHIVFDHSFTQGLLNSMHDQESSYFMETSEFVDVTNSWYTNALDPFSYLLLENMPIITDPSITVNDIMNVHNDNMPFSFNNVAESRVSYQMIENMKANLMLSLQQTKERIEKIDTTKEKVSKFITCSTFGVSLFSNIEPTEKLSALIGSLILPTEIINIIAEQIQKKVKKSTVEDALNYIHAFWTNKQLKDKND